MPQIPLNQYILKARFCFLLPSYQYLTTAQVFFVNVCCMPPTTEINKFSQAAMEGSLLQILYPDPLQQAAERDCGYSQAVLFTPDDLKTDNPIIPNSDLPYAIRSQLIGSITEPNIAPADLVIYEPSHQEQGPWNEFNLRLVNALSNKTNGKDYSLMVVRSIAKDEPVIWLTAVERLENGEGYNYKNVRRLAAILEGDVAGSYVLQLVECNRAIVVSNDGASNTLSLPNGDFKDSNTIIPLTRDATITISDALKFEVKVSLAKGVPLEENLIQN